MARDLRKNELDILLGRGDKCLAEKLVNIDRLIRITVGVLGEHRNQRT